jgi:hypothetical protein
MRTEHLDSKINELETLRSRGELTYMGGEMLIEFIAIKQALNIPVVVGQSKQLECDSCKYIAIYEAYEISYLECLKCGKAKAY